MLITRKSTLTGKKHTKEIDVTNEQLLRWQTGELIQNVMPKLKPWEREFLISGSTEKEWSETFKKG